MAQVRTDGLESVDDAMASSSLIQYFRSFIIKLNMIEAQIGQLYLGGKSHFCFASGRVLLESMPFFPR